MPKSPDRPRDPAGKTPRKTYRLDAETLDSIAWIMARHGCSATDAIRISVAEWRRQLDRLDQSRP
jgi:hypothetical protein